MAANGCQLHYKSTHFNHIFLFKPMFENHYHRFLVSIMEFKNL